MVMVRAPIQGSGLEAIKQAQQIFQWAHMNLEVTVTVVELMPLFVVMPSDFRNQIAYLNSYGNPFSVLP